MRIFQILRLVSFLAEFGVSDYASEEKVSPGVRIFLVHCELSEEFRRLLQQQKSLSTLPRMISQRLLQFVRRERRQNIVWLEHRILLLLHKLLQPTRVNFCLGDLFSLL